MYSVKKGQSKDRQINQVAIRLASPDDIRDWSYGEVTKPETINYRSFKPEKDGLFCEKIFGPVRNWECNCGKYKRIRYRGVVCERCGVEVTHSKVRRERFGHIELAVPVLHIWFLRGTPSHIALLLGMPLSALERVVYYESYIVIDPGDTDYKRGTLLSEEEYIECEENGTNVVAKMGGEAINDLLSTIDMEELSIDLRSKINLESSEQRRQDHLKRLRVVEAFLNSGNKPENMVLNALPVLPPDLRPLVPLEGGRFATSDLNDLYRRVINRNNRLKKLMEIMAPDVILRNEMRMLQEAVDTLFDNGRRTSAVKGEGRRPLKSLSQFIKGKQGRFRQNLLGKRVDYSGRSVIVVGPELKIHQCGIPKEMALELFKPFIINKLEEEGFAQTVKSAKKFVEQESPEVWDILEEIIRDHPVLLNRAPTLHRLGIQAFFPVLVEGKAIQLHPLVCAAFNADFDGDQMAVHIPLSYEAQIEARFLMLSSNNLLSPASGQAIMVPSQDMVLGVYYLTKEAAGCKGEGKLFSSKEEIFHALAEKVVDLHARIKIRINGELTSTTPGRVIFNDIIPSEGYEYRNELFNKKKVQKLVSDIIHKKGNVIACEFLDNLKRLGYHYATQAGVTFSMKDLIVPKEKDKVVNEAIVQADRIRSKYERGIITEGERYNKIIDLWTHCTNQTADMMDEALAQDKDGFNPVFIMKDSGARGSKDQIKQLAAMRGLMQKPQKKITGSVGEIIENPITSNFKDGHSVLEYFISTHGARKGLADTALKTADAGYLTRRLVDVVHDMVVTEADCNTVKGINVESITEGDETIEPLSERLVGRTAQEDVYDPITDEVICHVNEEIDEGKAQRIEECGIDSVLIRSILTCDSEFGVCKKCYGRNLALGKLVELGESVGIMAAQSIGEPGTQLTLRTFHIGGTASHMVAQSKESAKIDATVVWEGIDAVDHSDGTVVLNRAGQVVLKDEKEIERFRLQVPYGSYMDVKDGHKVKKGKPLFHWDPHNNVILATAGGTTRFVDLVEGETLKQIYDDESGVKNYLTIEHREKRRHPHIQIFDENDNCAANIPIPAGAYLQLQEGKKVSRGDILVKIPREGGKSLDITGGLPRVAELFEARRPKNAATISEIDGYVSFGDNVRGKRRVIVRDDEGNKKEYQIPLGKHLRVHENDWVRAGDRLCEGAIDPHDILRIKGEEAVQQYFLNEVQAVYRLQGVSINDRHMECIIAQMLKKVQVENPGDTNFLTGDTVDKSKLNKANEMIVAEGGTPASFKPLLLGITRASLNTDSFLSAASFQETTRVLANATIEGKVDELRGLKENVLMGNLIPAGTGLREYRKVEIEDLDSDVVNVEEHDEDEDFIDIAGEG